MIRRHKQEAAPVDETEAAMIYLDNDCANGCSRLTEAEIQHALYTPTA